MDLHVETCSLLLVLIAIEQGLIEAKTDNTKIIIRAVNTGSIIEATIPTPNKKLLYIW